MESKKHYRRTQVLAKAQTLSNVEVEIEILKNSFKMVAILGMILLVSS